jgi:hypothetical protein
VQWTALLCRRNTCGELSRSNSRQEGGQDGPGGQETEEFRQAVDSFDQLYKEGEIEEQKETKKNVPDSDAAEEPTPVEAAQEWKQIKKGRSQEEPPKIPPKSGKKKSEKKKKRGRLEGSVDINQVEVADTTRPKAAEEGEIHFSEVQKTQDVAQSTLREVVRVQRHSLGVQDGVMVERTTTLARTESGDGDDEESIITPDSLKNVDGQPKVG